MQVEPQLGEGRMSGTSIEQVIQDLFLRCSWDGAPNAILDF